MEDDIIIRLVGADILDAGDAIAAWWGNVSTFLETDQECRKGNLESGQALATPRNTDAHSGPVHAGPLIFHDRRHRTRTHVSVVIRGQT